MSDDLTARLEAESYWETTDYGKLRVVPYSLAVAALTAERTAHVEDEQAADEAYRLQGRELKRHIDLHEAWVKWAQFVWLDGGPVTGTDKELRQAVCERHDTAVAAERTAREQAEQALADAAREINCAGPVAHRIRVARAEWQARMEQAEQALGRFGFRRCDAPACNCNGWHGGHSAQRLVEIGDALTDANVETNGRTLLDAVKAVAARAEQVEQERDRLREALEKIADQACWCRSNEQPCPSCIAHAALSPQDGQR
jgi:hypothetical protein